MLLIIGVALVILMVINHEIGRYANRKKIYYPGVKLHLVLSVLIYILACVWFSFLLLT